MDAPEAGAIGVVAGAVAGVACKRRHRRGIGPSRASSRQSCTLSCAWYRASSCGARSGGTKGSSVPVRF